MIIVMGLPGAGKTTVLTEAVKKHPDYKVLNYGTMMLDIAKQKFGIKDRDEIRKLTADQQKEVQAEVGRKLSVENGKSILDTHCSILNPAKGFYLPGLPFELLKNLKVDMLVLVTGDVDEIAKRRANDPTRTRAVDPKEIFDHDQHNRMLLASYSALSGAPCKIILNRNGKLEEAVAQMAALM
jgi:adenylate kinase